MIKRCTDNESIIALWREAFGDSREDVEFFIQNVQHALCLGYYQGDELASMMYLVDCKTSGKQSKYIYAACTKKSCNSRGYMTKLIDYCRGEYPLLCLIPATDSLVGFYAKRGFTAKTEIADLFFEESDEIKEYLLEGYQLTEPQVVICERR